MDSSRVSCLPPLTAHTRVSTSGGGSRSCTPAQRGGRRRRTPDDSNERTVQSWTLAGDGDVLSDLHIKLAHIQWRKHANDNNIRKAISTTNRMRERDLLLQLSVDREGERGRWTEAIVRDEAARPADISEVFLKDWEQRDDEIRTRQLKGIRRHLQSLKRVERAVQSHAGGATKTGHQSGGGVDESNLNLSQQEEDTPNSTNKALRERLKALRIGIKSERRELRRAAKNDLREQFSASSFKTGRGRW